MRCSGTTRPRHVQVEAQRHPAIYEVDLERRTCTCRCHSGGLCSHVRKAVDIHEDGCKRFHYEIASALHKEIRRGDPVRALHWADLRARSGPKAAVYVKSYARQICGEETRNARLIWTSLGRSEASDYRDCVSAIARSRKKWELATTATLFRTQMLAWKRVKTKTTLTSWDEPSCVGTIRRAAVRGDPALLHEGLWWVCENVPEGESVWRELDGVLADAVRARVPEIPRPLEMISAFEKSTKRDAFEIRLMFIEALCGGWNETANEFCHHDGSAIPPSERSMIPRFPDYVYDVHVRRRRRRAQRWRASLRPGQPSPGRLDLRWSGEMIGVAWRYAAYEQLGSVYLSARWEDVNFSDTDWTLAEYFNQDDA